MSRIFVSYKRKDSRQVYSIIDEIKSRLGVDCWYDIDGIETQAQFVSKICCAIDQAEVVLFMHSKNHLDIDFENDWTIKELNYATVKKKKIILVKLDDAPLENIFLFEYGSKNYITAADEMQRDKLIKDLGRLLKITSTPLPTPDKEEPKPEKKRSRKWLPFVLLALLTGGLFWGLFLLDETPKDDSYDEMTNEPINITDIVDEKQELTEEPKEVEEVEEIKEIEDNTRGVANNHEWVDLGLSVMWATCNVGANSPEEYGDYYAWGEIETKAEYTRDNYKWFDKSKKTEYGSPINTKYNTNEIYGKIDNKTKLDLEDDVAYVIWGDGWRMPTYNEWNELRSKCKWVWVEINGVQGYEIKSNINENSIFLPAAGMDKGKYGRETGHYWSSNKLSSGWCANSVDFDFRANRIDYYTGDMENGQSVRPVYAPNDSGKKIEK